VTDAPSLHDVVLRSQVKPRIVVLDVGHGSCAVLTDGAAATVIDAGQGSVLMEFLLQEGITTIKSVVLSHADHDHIGGLIAIFSSGLFTVEKIHLNSDSVKATKAWDSLLFEIQALEESGQLVVTGSICNGDKIDANIEGISIMALGPRRVLAMRGPGSRDPQNRLVTPNSISAVLMISVNSEPTVLLTGDMDAIGFDDLCGAGHDLRAEFLVLPHHGGAWGLGADSSALVRDLCQKVQPREVIVSNGRGKFDNPRPKIIAAVRKAAPNAHVSCTQLSKMCSGELPTSNPAVDDSVFSAGEGNGVCCAGSVVLNFGTETIRDVSKHGQFVDSFSETALCRKVFAES
jgi:beta-lactamase superfamily II metal-dependent hydrolase